MLALQSSPITWTRNLGALNGKNKKGKKNQNLWDKGFGNETCLSKTLIYFDF